MIDHPSKLSPQCTSLLAACDLGSIMIVKVLPTNFHKPNFMEIPPSIHTFDSPSQLLQETMTPPLPCMTGIEPAHRRVVHAPRELRQLSVFGTEICKKGDQHHYSLKTFASALMSNQLFRGSSVSEHSTYFDRAPESTNFKT